MEDMYWAGEYKSKIIKLIIKSDETIKLMNPQLDERFDIQDILLGGKFEIDGSQVLLQGYVFDYYFVPSTIIESKVFICVETEVKNISDDTLSEFSLIVNVFTEKDNVAVNEGTIPTKTEMSQLGYAGNRIDMLCQSIEKILRGRKDFGIGKVKRNPLNYSTISAPTIDYYGRSLRYIVKNYTKDSGDNCGN
jgi:hypothetical protein